ncbi:MAG TPA: hypothetical protein VIL09_09340 [Microvirga sp.]|jgi:hypothetical protein
MFKKSLMVGIAALTMGGALATSTNSAQAQVYFGTGYYGGYAPVGYHGGYYGGYRSVGYYGGYRPVGYYGGHYGGYRPVGYYRGYAPQAYGYPYYRRRSNGGAVAAGLIGGLALGAIAANAARPVYYNRPVYSDCFVERRRTVNRYGNVVVRRVRVCD